MNLTNVTCPIDIGILLATTDVYTGFIFFQVWPDYEKNPFAEEFRKIFVGGLDKKTTKESLVDYFVQYGDVVNCEIKNQGDGSK